MKIRPFERDDMGLMKAWLNVASIKALEKNGFYLLPNRLYRLELYQK